MTRLGVRLVLVLAIEKTISCDRATKHLAATTLAGAPAQSFLAEPGAAHPVCGKRRRVSEHGLRLAAAPANRSFHLWHRPRTARVDRRGRDLSLDGMAAPRREPRRGPEARPTGSTVSPTGPSSTSSTSVSVRFAAEDSTLPTLPSCLAWRSSWLRKWHAHADCRKSSRRMLERLRVGDRSVRGAGGCRALCVMAAVVAWTAATVGCAGKHAPTAMPSPPALVVGEFVDDYGSRYTITAKEWFHQPAIRYRVVKWNLEEHGTSSRRTLLPTPGRLTSGRGSTGCRCRTWLL